MKEQFEEHLSVLMDGEMSELETRRLLKQLDDMNAEERQAIYATWSRYHRVGEALGDEHGNYRAQSGFATAVAEAITQEDLPSGTVEDRSPAQSSRSVSVPLWSRFAVAASVALAVVVGVQQYQLGSTGQTVQLADAALETATPEAKAVLTTSKARADIPVSGESYAVVASATEELSPDAAAEAQQRLHDYLLEHANNAARQNGQGITPFARVANFEEE